MIASQSGIHRGSKIAQREIARLEAGKAGLCGTAGSWKNLAPLAAKRRE